MASPLEQAIREHVRDYVVGRLSLRELDAWLWPATQEIENVDNPGARDLTYEIILRVAEYDKGHRTDAEVMALLQAFAAPLPAVGMIR